MTFFQMMILTITVFLCIYITLDRICKCIEHGRTAKAYDKLQDFIKETVKKEENEE